MIDIKQKIKELCKGHVDNKMVEAIFDKYSINYLYSDFVKDIFADHDTIDLNDNYTISMNKYDEDIEYELLYYPDEEPEDGQPKILNSFSIKNPNPNPTGIFFG